MTVPSIITPQSHLIYENRRKGLMLLFRFACCHRPHCALWIPAFACC
jgi:hypothetical protein